MTQDFRVPLLVGPRAAAGQSLVWDEELDGWAPGLVPDSGTSVSVNGEVIAPVDGVVNIYTGVTRSTNLIDASDVEADMRYAAGAGTPSSFAGASLTGFIPVTGYFTASGAGDGGVGRVSYFDASQAWIADYSYGLGATTRLAPAGTAFVRFTLVTATKHAAQANLGQTLLPYEPGGVTLDPDVRVELGAAAVGTPEIAPAAVTTDKIAPGAVDLARAAFITPSSNLFNKATAQAGWRYAAGASTPSEFATFSLSEWVPLSGPFTTQDIGRVSYFDAARKWLADFSYGLGVTTRTPPAGTAFVRFSVQTSVIDRAQANLGTTLAPYEPGGGTLAPYVRITETQPQPPSRVKSVLDVGDLSSTFMLTTPFADMDAAVVADTATTMHGRYDALMAAHPTYITRTLVATETSPSALPVYAYTFTPEMPTKGAATVTPPVKVVVIAGQHGNERAAVWSCYHLMKSLCDDWTTDPILDTLRHNVTFVVVPIANPYGYNQFTRTNYNGVDLNRNWPTGWVLMGSPGPYNIYSGPSPASEAETVGMVALLNEHSDAAAGIDFHNFFTPGSGYDFLWVESPTTSGATVASAMIRRMDRAWKGKPFMDPSPSKFIGYVTGVLSTGQSSLHMSSLFPLAVTFEHCRSVVAAGGPNHGGEAMTMGMEAWTNFIAMTVADAIR